MQISFAYCISAFPISSPQSTFGFALRVRVRSRLECFRILEAEAGAEDGSRLLELERRAITGAGQSKTAGWGIKLRVQFQGAQTRLSGIPP
jgi:hypothetical protein